MQEFIKSLIVLVIGGSLIGLLVSNEKIGKGVGLLHRLHPYLNLLNTISLHL